MQWVEWAEPIAYGPLELKPCEFEQLQPHEFQQLFEGFKWRQENNENILAYFTCHLMNISGRSLKKSISPNEMLKPLRGKSSNNSSADDEAALLEEFAHVLKK